MKKLANFFLQFSGVELQFFRIEPLKFHKKRILFWVMGGRSGAYPEIYRWGF